MTNESHRTAALKEAPLTSPPQSRFACQICGKITENCCSDCKEVFYCSAEHQIQHWYHFSSPKSLNLDRKTHQYECKVLQASPANVQKQETIRLSSEKPIRQDSKRHSDLSSGSLLKKKEATIMETVRELERPEEVKPVEGHAQSAGLNKKQNNSYLIVRGARKATQEFEHNVFEKFRRDRTKLLQEVMKYYMRFKYDQATMEARKLYEMSKQFFEEEENQDVYDLLADGLLFAKCLLAGENLSRCREQLLELWEITKEYVKDDRIDYKDTNKKSGKLRPKYVELSLQKNFVDHETVPLQKKNEINEYSSLSPMSNP